ncbi:hypothetical protein PRIPAC_97094, partial [Pristionchus pacificus]|uniref:Membrane transporter n=1 Tax=Pristionchus pacificus TaxID=54126 RepID=A0A2A6BXW4_PRIPA
MTPDDDSKSTTEEGLSNSISQSFEKDLKNTSREPVENGISQQKARRSTIIITATNWKVVRLTALVIFIYRAQYTVNSGSLHPMLKTMDPAMNQTFFGYITSIYNVGVAISAPTFGFLANKFGFRLPVLVTSIIMLLMNSGYIFLWNIPDNRRYYALIIRFFVGIAAGGSSILQFYWVTVTAQKDLSSAASYSDAAMSFGLAFGPVIQILTKNVGHPGTLLFGFLNIGMYTIPAMIAIVSHEPRERLCKVRNERERSPPFAHSLARCLLFMILVLIASAVLLLCFPKVDTKSSTDTDEVDNKNIEDIPLNYFLIFLCFGFRSVQNIIFANVETNNNQFIEWMFNYTKQESSIVGSALCSTSGLLGFFFLICYVWTGTSKRRDFKKYLKYFSFFTYNHIGVLSNINIVANLLGVFIGFVACLIFLLGSFPYPSYNEFIVSTGCNATWCSETPAISLPLFVTVYLLIFSVGFPLLSVHTSALLATTLGGRKQAHIHGLANFVSTVARVAAGPLMGHVLEEEGIEVLANRTAHFNDLHYRDLQQNRVHHPIRKVLVKKKSKKVGPRNGKAAAQHNYMTSIRKFIDSKPE